MGTANPTIRKKESSFLTPTDNAKRLFQVIYQEEKKKEEVYLPDLQEPLTLNLCFRGKV